MEKKPQGTNDLDMSLGKKLIHVTVIHICYIFKDLINTCYTLGNYKPRSLRFYNTWLIWCLPLT